MHHYGLSSTALAAYICRPGSTIVVYIFLPSRRLSTLRDHKGNYSPAKPTSSSGRRSRSCGEDAGRRKAERSGVAAEAEAAEQGREALSLVSRGPRQARLRDGEEDGLTWARRCNSCITLACPRLPADFAEPSRDPAAQEEAARVDDGIEEAREGAVP